MHDWTHGYVADVNYTYGYYPELNPLRIRLAFLNQGLRFPEVGAACELGYGQGVSTNLHAAASTVEWCGTDFNPAQAVFAQELAGLSQAGPSLYDDDFACFVQRADLPDFDFIALHGIWSWISDDNRKHIVDFVRRKLKPGGVLYISYNALPGWSDFLTIRHIMAEHAATMSAAGEGIVSRVNKAIEFTQQMLAAGPLHLQAAPKAADMLRQLQGHDRHYIAHEYFNRDWKPMHFSEMAQWLAPAKLQFACSAMYMDAIESMFVTSEQKKMLDGIPNPLMREGVRDVMLNRRFRKDYWVKGARRLSPTRRIDMLRQQRLVLLTHASDVPLQIKMPTGEIPLQDGLYRSVLEVMADHVPRSLGEMESHLKSRGIQGGQLLVAVLVLVEGGHLAPVQDDATALKVVESCQSINRHLIAKACEDADVQLLASPLIGGGVAVGRINQLFMRAILEGKSSPQAWAEFAWQVLSAQGQSLVKDGKTLDSPEENMRELLVQAIGCRDKQKPILQALQVWPVTC